MLEKLPSSDGVPEKTGLIMKFSLCRFYQNKIKIGQRDMINPSNIFIAKETPNERKRQPSEQEKKKKKKFQSKDPHKEVISKI